jgi:hypothetical protein
MTLPSGKKAKPIASNPANSGPNDPKFDTKSGAWTHWPPTFVSRAIAWQAPDPYSTKRSPAKGEPGGATFTSSMKYPNRHTSLRFWPGYWGHGYIHTLPESVEFT